MGQFAYTAIVAGGAGFLGFHLCKRLLKEGCRVICVDDLSTGERAHVNEFAGNERYEFIRHDVRQPVDIAGTVDRIYNLACPASPPA